MTTPVPAEIRKAAHDATMLPLAQAIATSPYELVDMAVDAVYPLIVAADRDYASDIAYLKGMTDGTRTERERIAQGAAAAALTLWRPGSGPGDDMQQLRVVPLDDLRALLAEGTPS